MYHIAYFYPRSPCGERLHSWRVLRGLFRISIHALLAESDAEVLGQAVQPWKFLSTLSLRRATPLALAALAAQKNFYPRSPCGERLTTRGWPLTARRHFYPRSPCGERPAQWFGRSFLNIEISIHALLAESDLLKSFLLLSQFISIHALLAESDQGRANAARIADRFLSTLSLRRAT